MTLCIAIACRDGLVALADTRISKGAEILNKGKLATHAVSERSFFSMTSGLRSIRDKALIYLDEAVAAMDPSPQRLYQIANLLGEQLRRVRVEDGSELARSALQFNLHAIIGGRLPGDRAPALFLIYPEGNWIEVNQDSPFFVIGRTTYGAPLLARNLRYDMSLREAAMWATMAFDLTTSSASDVDFPIDIVVLANGDNDLRRQRYERDDVAAICKAWHASVARELRALPTTWLDPLFSENR